MKPYHWGIVCPEVSGHLNPITTLGRELQKRGHRISVLIVPDGQAKVESAGLDYLPIGAERFPKGIRERDLEQLGRLSGLKAFRFTIQRFCQVAEVTLDDAPKHIHDSEIDGMIVDQVYPAGITICEHLGLPAVTVCNAIAAIYDPRQPPVLTAWAYRNDPLSRLRYRAMYAVMDRLLAPAVDLINRYRKEWNLSPLPHREFPYSSLAQITQQPAIFDFPQRNLAPHFHYTAPFHDERSGDATAFPYEKLDGRSLIYASLGTLQNRLDHIFYAIAQACEGLDAQLVVSLGNKNQTVFPHLPGSPLIAAYAPQLELLKRASLVITHAGLNTVLETLSQGVPMVAIPIANDQPGVAARLAYLGAGEMIPLKKVTSERLRALVQKVSANPVYRERARAVQTEVAKINGVVRAADIIEQALTTQKPVLR